MFRLQEIDIDEQHTDYTCPDDIEDDRLFSHDTITPEQISQKQIIQSLFSRETNGSRAGEFERNVALRMVPQRMCNPQFNFDTRVFNCRFVPDGNRLISTSQDQITIINTENPFEWELEMEIANLDVQWTITDIDMSPDNSFMAFSTHSPRITLVDFEQLSLGNIQQSLKPLNLAARTRPFGIFSVKISGDSKELVCGTGSSGIVTYDLVNEERLACIQDAHTDDINTICFADRENSQIIYSGSDDSSIKVWDKRVIDSNTRKSQGVLIGHREGITHISSKGDGFTLISNSKDQSLKLWDIRRMSTHKQYTQFRKHHNYQTNFDYRWLPYPMANYTRRLSQDNSVMTFRGHQVLKTLIKCYFSPLRTTGQRYIYSGSADGIIAIYDSVTGKTVKRLGERRAGMANLGIIRDLSWHPHVPVLAHSSSFGEVNYYYY